ncbi:hypothetical protein ALI44B_14925 [Leifsonia sp. ALI-44-B]|uniref:FMN-binding protein n=1 Tax=Leifsonia sp. ALI-44-B TaxID=1933776 RepID=UPI00097C8D8F|nr:hypothetical protein [Leifsonia sp. ALI-44-B]ONI61998.1 hypothetical protein ALI44B_14925 [Leifsonia sp. ALI-44-B]
MKTSTRQNTAVALAGIAVIGGLAGCSSAGADAEGTGSTSASTPAAGSTSESSSGAAGSGADASALKDGTYTEDGSYNSPGGEESITVKLTLAGGVIEDLDVTSNATNPNSKKYQGEFVDGINDIVVGKSIDDLNVSKVAGSSLTSGGFNDAIDKIIADAS